MVATSASIPSQPADLQEMPPRVAVAKARGFPSQDFQHVAHAPCGSISSAGIMAFEPGAVDRISRSPQRKACRKYRM
jgi:hypothetical protein